ALCEAPRGGAADAGGAAGDHDSARFAHDGDVLVANHGPPHRAATPRRGVSIALRRSVSALFPRWSNTIYRAALATLVIGTAALIVAPMIYIRTPYAADRGDAVLQPIDFDHRDHVRDDGIDCVYCHDTVETEASAGMPSTARCMGCHVQIWSDRPELGAARGSWANGTPIRWKRVNAVPSYVYFHHGVHVQA